MMWAQAHPELMAEYNAGQMTRQEMDESAEDGIAELVPFADMPASKGEES